MQAGFQSGDVITGINGEPVVAAEDYEKILRGLTVDDVVHITYERQGAEDYIPLEIDAKVGVLE